MLTYIWITVAIVAVVVELLTAVSLVSIWFVVGALFAALLSLTSLSFFWQAVAFVVVSIIALALLRPFLLERLRGNIIATNTDRIIGKTAKLTKDITDDSWGVLRINGSEWSCVALGDKNIKEGTTVKILAIEGAKLIVEEY